MYFGKLNQFAGKLKNLWKVKSYLFGASRVNCYIIISHSERYVRSGLGSKARSHWRMSAVEARVICLCRRGVPDYSIARRADHR